MKHRNCALWTAATVAGVLTCSLALAGTPRTPKGRNCLTAPGAEWHLVWSDEFDEGHLDTSKWTIGLPWTGDDGTNRHHNDQYASYIADNDVEVHNGTLRLFTRKGPFQNGGKTYDYSEGLIHTDPKSALKYGYFEVRARIPVDAGPGLWPAFWMLSEGWPPEMDILETWTSTNRSHQGLAYRKDDGQVGWDDTNTNTPVPAGWHTYGMEWGPGYQTYNIDGRITKTVSGNHVPNKAMYIILNSGVESGRPPTGGTAFPNIFDVDYVRVFERMEGPAVLNGGFEVEEVAPWKLSGRALVVGYGAHSANHALRLDDTKAAATQTIYGLTPNTRYTVDGWVRVTGADDVARIGVTDHGGSDVGETTSSTQYTRLFVSFTTGPAATSAVLTCNEPTGNGSAFFDTLSIKKQ